MGLEDLSDAELIKLRRTLPDNASAYRYVCAELLKRSEQDESLLDDFLGYGLIFL